MKNCALIALVVAVLLLGVTTAAYADHAYTAHARAVGLILGMTGQTLPAAFTDARVQSGEPAGGKGCGEDTNACASAAGLAEPFGRIAHATAPGSQRTKTAPANDFVPTSGTVFDEMITGQIGPSTAVASPPTNTRAKGTTGQSVLSVNLGHQVAALGQRIRTELPSVVDRLGVLAQSDPSGATRRVADGLERIVQNPAAQPLVKIMTDPAFSESTDQGDETTATAIANGGQVVIGPAAVADGVPESGVPVGGITPEGFIVVRITKSMVTATTDQKTGTADFSPPEVTVASLADANLGNVRMLPGQSGCFAVSTPFETCVAVSSGAKRVEGAAAAATVGGVEISTLRTQGKNAINLHFGVVEAGVNARGRQISVNAPKPSALDRKPSAPAQQSTHGHSRNLPTTGGTNLAVPGLMLIGASGLTLAALRRRRA
jgi:hypothetical protein